MCVQEKQIKKPNLTAGSCQPNLPSLRSLPDLCLLWDWSRHYVSFLTLIVHFLGKVPSLGDPLLSPPSMKQTLPTPASTGYIFPLSAFHPTSPQHRVPSPWKVTPCGQVSQVYIPACSAGPECRCSITCRMGKSWIPWEDTEHSSCGHLCLWKACNSELGGNGEGTKSEVVSLQPTCQVSPGHSFPRPSFHPHV